MTATLWLYAALRSYNHHPITPKILRVNPLSLRQADGSLIIPRSGVVATFGAFCTRANNSDPGKVISEEAMRDSLRLVEQSRRPGWAQYHRENRVNASAII